MKNIYLLYPFFACTLSVHTLYAQNMAELFKEFYFKSLVTFLSITAIGYIGLYLLTHNLTLSALLFTLNYLAIMNANLLYLSKATSYKRSLKFYKERFVCIYILACLIASCAITAINKYINLDFLNPICFYLSVFLTACILIDISKKRNDTRKVIIKNKKIVEKECAKTNNIKNENIDYPDIYHIILDAHSGFAVPEYCDNKFQTALEERGFHIYTDHKSNYKITHLSMPSMLNMNYIDKIIKNIQYYHYSVTWPFYTESVVINKLRQAGYKCIFFGNRHLETIFIRQSGNKSNSNYFRNIKKFNNLNILILLNSIIALVKKLKLPHYPDYDLLDLMNAFAEHKISHSPQYNLLHILAPHYPYFFDENGKEISRSNYSNDEYYFTYLKYVDKITIKMLDEIKKKMKQNSLIILHSDHGLHTSPVKPYNILSAVYFPNKKDSSCIPKKTTLVNVFRCIFNKYFNCNYELLENKYYSHNPINFKIEAETNTSFLS